MEKNISNTTKRKKDKFNEQAPQIIDKRKPLKHEWQQTNSEVTITLFAGHPVNLKDVQMDCTDNSCSIKLPDGRVFSCELFKAVVPDGTDLKQKSNKLILKMVKRAPQNWKSLQVEAITDSAKEDAKPVIELDHIKHNYYEKGLSFLNVDIFVPNISKDEFSADFQEDHFILRFQTSNPKFLTLNNASVDSTFMWKVNVKEDIIPEDCCFRLSEVKVELTLKKKVAQRWNAVERITVPSPPTTLPNSDWVSAKQPSPPQKEESPAKVITSPPIAKKDPVKQDSNIVSSNAISKKPTCLVPPLSRDNEQIKGLTGLDNLGNTCFMNSVLQCLANTREFRDYFLESHFQYELNLENPLGTGGNLAVAYATLLRMLWSGTQRTLAPSKMKTLIGQKAMQFAGFAQHDAQELMAFLLDGLHEDLNRVKKKPYIENVECVGQSDEMAADESWRQYKKRNDSVVVDLFQGQYKSRLLCPVCQKVSITFDPFLYLSLPLPKRQWTLLAYFFSQISSQKPLKLSLRLSQDALVDELKEKVASQVSVKARNLRVFEVHKHLIHKDFPNGSSLSGIKPTDTIVIYEVMDEELAGEPILELIVLQRTMLPLEPVNCSNCYKRCTPLGLDKPKRCTKCYRAAYCDQNCQRNHWSVHKAVCKLTSEPVGFPFVVSMPVSRASYSLLVHKMEAYSRYSVDVFQPPLSPPKPFGSQEFSSLVESSANRISNIEITSPPPSNAQVNEVNKEKKSPCPEEVAHSSTCMVIGQPTSKEGEISQPLFKICVVDKYGQNLPDFQNYLPNTGDTPLDLELTSHLAMDWKNYKKQAGFELLVQSKDLEYEPFNEKDNRCDQEMRESTLDHCLQLFTEPEVLSPQEAWYCPGCKSHREATKELSLWRLPPVLIIQLKRFSFNNLIWRDKIDKMVHFPVRGLDLSPYIQKPQTPGKAAPIYDLYAVVNHTGNILGGHYTSYARLPDQVDTRQSSLDWRLFDDSYVNYIPESGIVSRAAYVLFYRQRHNEVKLLPPPGSPFANKESKERENAKILVQELSDSNLLQPGDDSDDQEDVSSSSVSQMDTVD